MSVSLVSIPGGRRLELGFDSHEEQGFYRPAYPTQSSRSSTNLRFGYPEVNQIRSEAGHRLYRMSSLIMRGSVPPLPISHNDVVIN
jgi:hypothetical protein